MRKYQLIANIFLIATSILKPLSANADTLFFHDAGSSLGTIATAGVGIGCYNGSNDSTYRLADESQGTSEVAKTFTPTTTTPPCLAQTADGGGDYLRWASPPLSGAVTVSGAITSKIYCQESNSSMNLLARVLVYRWSATEGGIVSTVWTSALSSECPRNSTYDPSTMPTGGTVTSTDFAIGDRFILEIQFEKSGGGSFNGSHTAGFRYDGTSGNNGDSYVTFTEVLTFSADSPNGRAVIQ